MLALVMAFAMVPTPAFAYIGDASGGLQVTASIAPLTAQKDLTVETDEGTWTYTLYTDVPEKAWNNKVYIQSFAPKRDEVLDVLNIPSNLDGHDVYGITGTEFDPKAKIVTIPENVAVQALKSDYVEKLVLGAGSGHQTKGFSTSGLTNLVSLELGDGSYFANANNSTTLETVTFGTNVTLIGKSNFKSCTALKSVAGSPSSIAEEEFKDCSKLSSFDFSETTSIGVSAFQGSGISGALELPKCIAIGDNAFRECARITAVSLPQAQSSVPNYSPFYGCSVSTVTIGGTIPGGSNNGLFGNCGKLKTIIVKPGVDSIGYETFIGDGDGAEVYNSSSNMTYEGNVLFNNDNVKTQVYPYKQKSVAAPTVITSVGELYTLDNGSTYQKFYENGVLTIPSTVTEIRDGALSGYVYENGLPSPAHIDSISLDSSNTSFSFDDGVLYDASKTTLIKAISSVQKINAPATVTAVSGGACQLCTQLESVSLPDEVLSIGGWAFYSCSKLSTFKLPSNLNSIGSLAFCGCVALPNLDIPDSVTSIGAGAFQITSIPLFTVGSKLNTESTIDSVNAEGGVPVASYFYQGISADDWNERTLNSSVKTLDFSKYKATFVPHYSFAGLTAVTEISLPAQVSQIGNGSFYFCSNLKDIYIYNPSAIQISTSSGGQGDSGSGNSDETYAVSQPGSFSWWNPNKESDSAGTGAKYEDYTGLNFYGYANDANSLVAFCKNMGHNFIPVVALEDIAAADNPFATSDQADFILSYGTGDYDYSSVAIADIKAGETPKVVASFGSKMYSGGGRVLADGEGCSIVFKNSADTAVTSFTTPGTYTAEITGDGKSVLGKRTVSFNVAAASTSIANAAVKLSWSSKAYNGKAQKPTVSTVGGQKLKLNTDYTVKYSNASSKNKGSYTVTVTGTGNYTGTAKAATYKITQAANTAKAKWASKTYSLKADAKTKKLSKASSVALPTVTTKFGTAAWKVTAKDKKKVLSLSGSKVKVKKGAKKGAYTLKLQASVSQPGNKNYKAASTKIVTVKVKVK